MTWVARYWIFDEADFARSVTDFKSSSLDFVLCDAWIVKYVPLFRATMPAAPASPCGTSSFSENALSPIPETGVSVVIERIALSNASFVRFFGPSATRSVPFADVQTHAETVKPGIGSSTSLGGFVVVPITACTSDVVTRLATAVLTDEMPADAALLVQVLAAAAAPLAAGELVAADGDETAPDAEADGEAAALALADADADAAAEPLGDPEGERTAEGLPEDVPSAAGEPLAPGVCVPDGPHAIARASAARTVEPIMVLMRRGRAGCVPCEAHAVLHLRVC